MEVSWNGGTPKSSILATHLTHTDMFAEDLQSRQDRAGSSRGRKGNQNKLVPTSCKVKEMIGVGIATCGMQVWDWNRNLDLNRNLWVAGFLWGIGIATCRNLRDAGFGTGIATSKWIATCRLQAFGTGIATRRSRLNSQPAECRLRIESRPAGCRVLGMESQLVRLRFRLRIESQPAGCRFWDWNHNLEVNRNLCGLQAFGTGIATCRLRIESQPAGCRFWDWNRNFDSNRNLWVAGFINRRDRKWSASQLAGWELSRNLRDAGFGIGIATSAWIATCGWQAFWEGLESQLAGCELSRNLRDAGFGTGIATSKWIATCRLQAFGTGIATRRSRLNSQPAECRLRIESRPAGCRFWAWNRNL